MHDDNLSERTYDELMGATRAYIRVKLDTSNPIEIGDFVSEFTSIASQYEKFVKDSYPDLAPEAHIFVKQVKRGSIIIDLIPFLPLFGGTEVAAHLEHINAVSEFIKTYGGKLKKYFKKRGKAEVEGASRSDLKDFMGSVEAIAKDPKGKASLEAVVFEQAGRGRVRAALKFNTKQAVQARTQIEKHQKRLEHKGNADHQRALMVFKQSNVKSPPVGKRTGEWVAIETISDRELPLIYASDLAEKRIKHEIREADDNVYKKGFVVDVNVETRGGRPVGYRVTNLHQVIDLPGLDILQPKPRELRYASSADKSVIEFVDELFSKIEVSQGHFFVSDGETFPTREQFFERIRGRLQHGREAVRLMRGFLAKYGELR